MKEIHALINCKRLKSARKQRHLSIKKASENIIDPNLLLKAEKGESMISFDQFRQLAERYQRNICYFYLDKEPNLKLRIEWVMDRIKVKIVQYLIRKWNIDDYLIIDHGEQNGFERTNTKEL